MYYLNTIEMWKLHAFADQRFRVEFGSGLGKELGLVRVEIQLVQAKQQIFADQDFWL